MKNIYNSIVQAVTVRCDFCNTQTYAWHMFGLGDNALCPQCAKEVFAAYYPGNRITLSFRVVYAVTFVSVVLALRWMRRIFEAWGNLTERMWG